MLFDKSYFKKLFQEFPELLCFLSKGVEATQDYQVTKMASWMIDMYEAAAE